MLIQGIDCSVVYIDPGATGSNDGTTPADALTTLPDPDTFAANTVYLCRRGTSNIGLSDGTVTNDNSYLFGMPKPGELFYDVAPSAAKTAWDADVADYANLISSGGAGISFTQDFGGVFGIEFKQNGHTAYYTIIDVTSTSLYGHFVIKCKFTDPSYDLTTSGSSSDLTTGAIYLRGNQIVAQDLHIERRAIDDDVTVSTSNAYALYIQGDQVTIDNVICWAQSCSYDATGGATASSGMAVVDSNDASVSDTTVNVVLNGYDGTSDDCVFSRAFYSHNNKLIKIRNLNLNVDRTISALPVSGDVLVYQFFEIDNFNINHSVVDIDGVYIDFSGMTAFDWEYSSVGKYIDIFVEHNEDTDGGKESRIKNLNITNPPAVQDSSITRMVEIQVPSRCTLENLNFNVGRHAVLIEASSVGFAGEDSIRIKDITVVGSLELKSVTFADVTSITRNDSTIPSNIGVYPPLVLRRANAHVKDLQLSSAWSNETQVYLDYVCFAFIDSLNRPLYWFHANHSTHQFSTLYVNNINGVDGNWYAANYRYRAQTNAAFRTGGANAALKFSATASDVDNPLFIGNRPFPGIKLTPTSTGSATVTVYAAVKLFATTTDIRKFFAVLIDSPSTATSGVTAMYNSTVHGNWVEDNDSTWNNDDGLTQYKCEIPIEVDRLEDIEVRIMYNWWENTNGYLYFDPLLVLS